MSKNRIITISREFGSGGRTIGKKVAEKLSIPCYDRALLEKIVLESGFHEQYVKEKGEYMSGGFMIPAFAHRRFEPTAEDYLWNTQCQVITEIAEKTSCVIVGRCADYILQGKQDCLNVFIHADMLFRADRIINIYGEREDTPRKRLKEKDRRRAAYYRFYTNMTWGNIKNYHITLDSGEVGIDQCAKIIAQLY